MKISRAYIFMFYFGQQSWARVRSTSDPNSAGIQSDNERIHHHSFSLQLFSWFWYSYLSVRPWVFLHIPFSVLPVTLRTTTTLRWGWSTWSEYDVFVNSSFSECFTGRKRAKYGNTNPPPSNVAGTVLPSRNMVAQMPHGARLFRTGYPPPPPQIVKIGRFFFGGPTPLILSVNVCEFSKMLA